MKWFVCNALLIGITTVSFLFCASTQTEEKTTSKDRRDTYATCYEESTGKVIGSQKSRSLVLISPDGRYRAYAESEAIASGKANGGSDECQNTSKLFVAGPNSHNFHVVLIIRPIPERHGNSIHLVDWAASGHRLLLAENAWEWGSEIFGSFVRIYDADSQVLSSGGLIDRAFQKYIGRRCVAILRPAGFSSSGNVVIGAEPYFDEGEDEPNKDSCVGKEGLWQVDIGKSSVRKLPNNYKVLRYGKEVLALVAHD
jgi:hypothetical protein